MRKRVVKPRWFPRGERGAGRLLGDLLPRIRKAVRGEAGPSVTEIARSGRSAFRVLVSAVISARTKDEVTREASDRLFAVSDTPRSVASLEEKEIADLIYPAGFYRTKARAIRGLSRRISGELGGRVPDTLEGLLSLPGVGRKTANLVLTLAFGKSGICVDTHVHRIVNRLGAVRTGGPVETEFALRRVLPRRFWPEINDLLVTFGRTVCTPVSPRCSVCPVRDGCEAVGVLRYR